MASIMHNSQEADEIVKALREQLEAVTRDLYAQKQEWSKAYDIGVLAKHQLADCHRECESLRADAERYRWLRKNQYVDYDCIWAEQPKLDWPPAESDIYDDQGKKLDWVIDAAMEKEE